jgi:hypothetical protein
MHVKLRYAQRRSHNPLHYQPCMRGQQQIAPILSILYSHVLGSALALFRTRAPIILLQTFLVPKGSSRKFCYFHL